MTLLPDIERYIERNFAAADRAAVLDLIGAAVLHDGQSPGPRLIRCALVASAGDLARLRTELGHLEIDYRDADPVSRFLHVLRGVNEPIGD